MKIAILGYGSRGSKAYMPHAVKMDGVEFVAVCEKRPYRLNKAKETLGLSDDMLFLSDKEFFAKGKLADLLFVTTQDQDHYEHAMTALDLGYDLLLEKPIAHTYQMCVDIAEKAKKLNRKVYVCHVLRYAPFFNYIKSVIDSGEIGEVRTINQTENIAYWHQAHSYVRGNWAIVEESTPQVVAKTCHDLDILYWLIGKDCTAVSSFGSLDYYVKANAPEGCADHCFECKYKDTCEYNCIKFYNKRGDWLYNNVDEDFDYKNPQDIERVLSNKENPYSRCVFKCNNTATDHQVVNMLFEGGATAHLTLTAFADECYREIHVHGTKGDILGNMETNMVSINVYGKDRKVVDIGAFTDGSYGHGGGDERLIMDVVNNYLGKDAKGLTLIQNSLMSHKMGYAAEESRVKGGELVKI